MRKIRFLCFVISLFIFPVNACAQHFHFVDLYPFSFVMPKSFEQLTEEEMDVFCGEHPFSKERGFIDRDAQELMAFFLLETTNEIADLLATFTTKPDLGNQIATHVLLTYVGLEPEVIERAGGCYHAVCSIPSNLMGTYSGTAFFIASVCKEAILFTVVAAPDFSSAFFLRRAATRIISYRE